MKKTLAEKIGTFIGATFAMLIITSIILLVGAVAIKLLSLIWFLLIII
jgi:hypothetical protein